MSVCLKPKIECLSSITKKQTGLSSFDVWYNGVWPITRVLKNCINPQSMYNYDPHIFVGTTFKLVVTITEILPPNKACMLMTNCPVWHINKRWCHENQCTTATAYKRFK